MATIFKPKRSRNVGNIPTVGQLADGEIAVNIPDQLIYIRDGGDIKIIAQAPTGNTAKWINITHLTGGGGGATVGVIAQRRYYVDCRTEGVNLILPSTSLSVGDSVEVADPYYSWGINRVRVDVSASPAYASSSGTGGTLSGDSPFKDQLGNLVDGPLFLDISGARVSFMWTGIHWGIVA
jgi:hypothetical protein